MTWTPATETNLDFESDGTGWTVVNGTPRYVNISDDGGTRAFQGGSSDGLTRVKQAIAIPANSKRVRLTAWLGRSAADNDQGIAYLAIYNSSAELIGGIALRSAATSTVEMLEYTEQIVLPAGADSAEIFVVAARGVGGTSNHGACASVEIDWFIDAGLTIYTTPTVLINGDFEAVDTVPPGWTIVSGSDIISTTDSAYVFDGTRGITTASDTTQVIEQIVNIPDGAEQVEFNIVSSTNNNSQNERIRARLYFYDSSSLEISNIDQQGPEGAIGQVFVSITATSIPVNAVSVGIRLYLYTAGAANTGFDAATLRFTSETAPIDITGKFFVRLANGSWLRLNPKFTGANTVGLVTGPGAETGLFLRDDGTWATPAGGGGTSDHGALSGLADDDHPQYFNQTRGDARYTLLTTHTAHASDGSIHYPQIAIDHTVIQNIGTNTHAQIDTHIADASVHFTEASIAHANISGIGTNTHAQIDTHIANASVHFTEASIAHANISGVGTNTHAQIDTHIANASVHFTEASIAHANISGVGTNTHAQIDTHIADASIHFTAPAVISQVEAEAGVATTTRYFTAERVRQAVQATAHTVTSDKEDSGGAVDYFSYNTTDALTNAGSRIARWNLNSVSKMEMGYSEAVVPSGITFFSSSTATIGFGTSSASEPTFTYAPFFGLGIFNDYNSGGLVFNANKNTATSGPALLFQNNNASNSGGQLVEFRHSGLFSDQWIVRISRTGQIGARAGIGLHGKTAPAQHSTTGNTASFVAGGGTTATSSSTWRGSSGTTNYTVGDIVSALKDIGILAA